MAKQKVVQILILCPKCDSEDLIIKEKRQPLVVFKCGNPECGMGFYAYISHLPIPKFLLRQHTIEELSAQMKRRSFSQEEFLDMPVSAVEM